MAATKRTWVTAVVAIAVILAMAAIAGVGGVAYFVSSHIRTEQVEAAPADAKIAEARRRLAGQTPLIEIRHGEDAEVRAIEALPAASGSAATHIEALHALVYDPDERKLMDVTIPFWLIRLAPNSGEWSFMNGNRVAFDSRRIRLSAADLERLGPRLLIDHHAPDGQQLLVWTQ